MKSSSIFLLLILVGIFLLPSLLGDFRIGDDYGQDDLFLDTGEGYSGIDLRVFYKNGEMQEFNILPYPTFVPLMIPIDPGEDRGGDVGTVERVEADICFSVSYTGILEHFQLSIDWGVHIRQWGGSIQHTFADVKDSTVVGSTWESGHPLNFPSNAPIFNTQTIQGSALESAMSSKSDGDYRLIFALNVDLTMDFASGTSDTKSSSAQSEIQFAYAMDQITGLTVMLNSGSL